MDSQHLFASFCALLGLIAFALLVGVVLAVVNHLNDAMIVLLTAVITGAFTLLRAPASKNVTVDNPASDPVPTVPAS